MLLESWNAMISFGTLSHHRQPFEPLSTLYAASTSTSLFAEAQRIQNTYMCSVPCTCDVRASELSTLGPHILLTYLWFMHLLANSAFLLTLIVIHCAFHQYAPEPMTNVPFHTLCPLSWIAFLKLYVTENLFLHSSLPSKLICFGCTTDELEYVCVCVCVICTLSNYSDLCMYS